LPGRSRESIIRYCRGGSSCAIWSPRRSIERTARHLSRRMLLRRYRGAFDGGKTAGLPRHHGPLSSSFFFPEWPVRSASTAARGGRFAPCYGPHRGAPVHDGGSGPRDLMPCTEIIGFFLDDITSRKNEASRSGEGGGVFDRHLAGRPVMRCLPRGPIRGDDPHGPRTLGQRYLPGRPRRPWELIPAILASRGGVWIRGLVD